VQRMDEGEEASVGGGFEKGEAGELAGGDLVG
jgi:hypothetical protein